MASKKKTVQDIVDPQPSEEELVVQEAPTIEEIVQQAPEGEGSQPETLVSPLEWITEMVWIDPTTGGAFKLDQRKRGEYLLRPYYGA